MKSRQSEATTERPTRRRKGEKHLLNNQSDGSSSSSSQNSTDGGLSPSLRQWIAEEAKKRTARLRPHHRPDCDCEICAACSEDWEQFGIAVAAKSQPSRIELDDWLARYASLLASVDKLLHEIRFCSNRDELWQIVGMSEEVEQLHDAVIYEADAVQMRQSSARTEP